MEKDYNKFIITNRVRKSKIPRKKVIDEFYSDRSRILYCSSFRRLQQKAQVFSLEPNASVRTRLTHSLEVSDIGRTLANIIAYNLSKDNKLTRNNIQVVVSIVENACLLHDIGNPPFGHFGEAAIKDWSKKSTFLKNFTDTCANPELFRQLLKDFYEFDGNPQGFRTVTRLHTEQDEFGLNLTYATLLSILKYSRAAGEEVAEKTGIMKKAGYFQTECGLVKKVYEDSGLQLNHRFPFTYIMEAADDIAYCMSDIADGIEKGILTEESFLNEFLSIWNERYRDGNNNPIIIPVKFPTKGKYRGFSSDISIPWSKQAMKEAVDNFFLFEDDIYKGNAPSLISEDGKMGKVLDTIKAVSRKCLYTSIKAESIELTGYSVITGILNRYERLLMLPTDEFENIVNNKGNEYERRLYNRLGRRYIDAYRFAIQKLKKEEQDYILQELWLRIHLVVDHISGMTDEFALETYQMLEGIQLLKC